MSKFNLKSLLNERAMNTEEVEENKEAFEIKILDIDMLEPSKENFYNVNEIEEMKQSIELLGIEQNLVVKKDGDKYKVLAGHRRRVASLELVKEGKEKYRWIPCRVKNATNEILDKLTIIMTNSTQRELIEWEKMKQALEIEKLVIDLKAEANITGRTRDLLAEITNISTSQLGRYKAIQNNLSKELMEEFKNNKIGLSVAYEISGLSAIGQLKALTRLRENNTLVLYDVKHIKREEEEIKARQQENTLSDYDDSYREQLKDETEDIKEEKVKSVAKDVKEVNIYKPVAEEHKEEKCRFCDGEQREKIKTQSGAFTIDIDPITRFLRVIDNITGEMDTMQVNYCPLCSNKLNKDYKE